MESHIFARPTSRRSCPQHWPLSPAEGDSVRHVHTPQPIPNQTGLNAWQLKNPHSAQAVLGPQETVGNFLLPLISQYEAAARQFFVSALARNNEAHN